MNRQKLKLALIPVLAVTLLVVLRGEPAETDKPAPRQRRPELPIATTVTQGGAVAPSKIRPRSLDEVTAFNPFAPPARANSEISRGEIGVAFSTTGVPASNASPLRGRLRIDAILKNDGDFRAVIAGKLVRTGDLIDEGRFRVVGITAHDVTFQRVRP